MAIYHYDDFVTSLSVEYDCKVVQVADNPFRLPIGLKVYAHYGSGLKVDITSEYDYDKDSRGQSNLKLLTYSSQSGSAWGHNRIPSYNGSGNTWGMYFAFEYEGVLSERIPNLCCRKMTNPILSPAILTTTNQQSSVNV